jgi:hypothetical protein
MRKRDSSDAASGCSAQLTRSSLKPQRPQRHQAARCAYGPDPQTDVGKPVFYLFRWNCWRLRTARVHGVFTPGPVGSLALKLWPTQLVNRAFAVTPAKTFSMPALRDRSGGIGASGRAVFVEPAAPYRMWRGLTRARKNQPIAEGSNWQVARIKDCGPNPKTRQVSTVDIFTLMVEHLSQYG